MPRMSEQARDARRRTIILCAAEVFAKNGFDKTTTVMIAERGGFAEGTIFAHFRSKSGLLRAIFRFFWKRLYEQTVERSEDETDSVECVRSAIHSAIEFAREYEHIYRVVTANCFPPEADPIEPVVNYHLRYRVVITRLLEDLQAEGCFRSNRMTPEFAYMCLLGTLEHALSRVYQGQYLSRHSNHGFEFDDVTTQMENWISVFFRDSRSATRERDIEFLRQSGLQI